MPKPIKLSIGMAVYDDYGGTIALLQQIRLVCWKYKLSHLIELLVVDNKPDSPLSETLRLQMQHFMPEVATKYIAMGETVGTTQARNRVFAEASGEFTICCDCHILFWIDALPLMIQWIDEHPDCSDLLCGPITYDNLATSSTHFDDVWRDQMWGIWGSAWSAPNGQLFSVRGEQGKEAQYLALGPGAIPITSAGDYELPKIPYVQHELALVAAGCRRLCYNAMMTDYVDDDAFEVPGQGLGMFACRTDSWLGFNPNFLGFGSEEMYIHTKYRQAGRKTVCLSFLRWWHRFPRPQGARYPNNLWDRVRNYVLGHIELGLDVQRVYQHFVHEVEPPKRFAQADWDVLMLDPMQIRRAPQTVVSMPAPAEAPKAIESLDELYEMVRAKPRDLNEHFPLLRDLASKVNHVTEISKRRESAVALAAGKPETFVSYNTEAADPLFTPLRQFVPGLRLEAKASPDVPDIEETDLLFIDSKHTEDRLTSELTKFAPKVKRFIVLHDTVQHSLVGEDNGPGLHAALQKYTLAHPEWFAVSHFEHQYGMTVIGRREEDRPTTLRGPHHTQFWAWAPGFGPGTKLKIDIIEKYLGVKASPTCGCTPSAIEMDMRGVANCRTTRDEIVGWVRNGYKTWGWGGLDDAAEAANDGEQEQERKKTLKEKISFYWKAVTSGLALEILKRNPLDPIGSVVDWAIDLAEADEQAGKVPGGERKAA